MTRQQLEEIQIEPPNGRFGARVKANWDKVAKPLDGLGVFEQVTAQIGAITQTEKVSVSPRAILAFCADNGIVAEGVSQSGQEVSSIVAAFMGRGTSSVGKMAERAEVDVIVTDIGLAQASEVEGVRNCKVRRGTRNFLREAAMTEEETLTAIEIGIETVREAADRGYRILGTGEMGIGNTTTSSAVAAALLGCPAEEVTGRGAGLSDAAFVRKREVIDTALRRYHFLQNEPFRILQTVGGLDIAGLAGVYIGGALCRIPVVMDGVISVVAALTAERLVPGVRDYVIASHVSREPAARRMMDELGASPVIDAQLALGEGTGAVMFFGLLDLAMALYESETTFGEMRVAPYERYI